MKNINKLLFISLGVFVLLFTACTEDLPEREPSPTTPANCAQVYFPDTNVTTLELEQDATSVPITISRGNTSGAVTVPLTIISSDAIFNIPESVSFGSGEAEVTFNVTFSGAEPGVNYSFEIIIEGDEYIDAYTVVDGDPSVKFTISLSDWADFASGTYVSAFFETEWTQVMQYSAILDQYRLPNLFVNGYHFIFEWVDGEEGITPVYDTNEDGYYIFETGFMHPTYGMVTVLVDASTDWTYYVASADAFVFDGEWTVGAGSWGWLDDVYYIEERY